MAPAAGRPASARPSRSALLLAYNLATTGHVFHPGYEYQYQLEAARLPAARLQPRLGDRGSALPAPEPRDHVPVDAGVLPERAAGRARHDRRRRCARSPAPSRGLFDPDCPLAVPRDIGMSILLTSPAYLLVDPGAVAGYGRTRLVDRRRLAVLAVAFVNLMHFSQGWVQFGYRFSNDFVAFALPSSRSA